MSPRPKLRRRIRGKPKSYFFKPAGIPVKDLEEINLKHDEFEALRLIDYEELSQEESSNKMNISQPTFSRILSQGRKKIAEAVVNGNAIKIETSFSQTFKKLKRHNNI